MIQLRPRLLPTAVLVDARASGPNQCQHFKFGFKKRVGRLDLSPVECGSRTSDKRKAGKDTNPKHAETLHEVAANYDGQDYEAELQFATWVDRLAETILDKVIFRPIYLTTDSPTCDLSPLHHGVRVAPYGRIIHPFDLIVSIVLVIVANPCIRGGTTKTIPRDIISISYRLEDIGAIGDSQHIRSIRHYSPRIRFNAILIPKSIPICGILKMLEAEMWRVII